MRYKCISNIDIVVWKIADIKDQFPQKIDMADTIILLNIHWINQMALI